MEWPDYDALLFRFFAKPSPPRTTPRSPRLDALMTLYYVELNAAGDLVDVWPMPDFSTMEPAHDYVYRVKTRHGDEAEAIYEAQRKHHRIAQRNLLCPDMF